VKRAKKLDLSRYFTAANLTDKQYECYSLKFEYGLTVSAIARELNRNRKTIDQHIASAQIKMRSAGFYDKVRKQLAKSHPGE
jgi:DNA-binding CsgD family transcriptional regulator